MPPPNPALPRKREPTCTRNVTCGKPEGHSGACFSAPIFVPEGETPQVHWERSQRREASACTLCLGHGREPFCSNCGRTSE